MDGPRVACTGITVTYGVTLPKSHYCSTQTHTRLIPNIHIKTTAQHYGVLARLFLLEMRTGLKLEPKKGQIYLDKWRCTGAKIIQSTDRIRRLKDLIRGKSATSLNT